MPWAAFGVLEPSAMRNHAWRQSPRYVAPPQPVARPPPLRAQPPVLDEDYWDRASVFGGSGTTGACAGEATSSWAPFRAGTAVTQWKRARGIITDAHVAFVFQSWQEAEVAAGSEVADSWHNVRHAWPFGRMVPDGALGVPVSTLADQEGKNHPPMAELTGMGIVVRHTARLLKYSEAGAWRRTGKVFKTELQSVYDSRRCRSVFRQCGASRMPSAFGRTLLTHTKAGARICSLFQMERAITVGWGREACHAPPGSTAVQSRYDEIEFHTSLLGGPAKRGPAGRCG